MTKPEITLYRSERILTTELEDATVPASMIVSIINAMRYDFYPATEIATVIRLYSTGLWITMTLLEK